MHLVECKVGNAGARQLLVRRHSVLRLVKRRLHPNLRVHCSSFGRSKASFPLQSLRVRVRVPLYGFVLRMYLPIRNAWLLWECSQISSTL